MSNPQGAILILAGPDGHVFAHAADFSRGGAAGFKESERQIIRARQLLYNKAIRSLCHPDIADVSEGYDAQQIVQRLCNQKGYKISEILIGYEDSKQ